MKHSDAAEWYEAAAAEMTGNEIMWLSNVLKELGFEVKQTSSLFMDNQSAVQVAKNPEHHGRMNTWILHSTG
jgi:hypothetical protein